MTHHQRWKFALTYAPVWSTLLCQTCPPDCFGFVLVVTIVCRVIASLPFRSRPVRAWTVQPSGVDVFIHCAWRARFARARSACANLQYSGIARLASLATFVRRPAAGASFPVFSLERVTLEFGGGMLDLRLFRDSLDLFGYMC